MGIEGSGVTGVVSLGHDWLDQAARAIPGRAIGGENSLSHQRLQGFLPDWGDGEMLGGGKHDVNVLRFHGIENSPPKDGCNESLAIAIEQRLSKLKGIATSDATDKGIEQVRAQERVEVAVSLGLEGVSSCHDPQGRPKQVGKESSTDTKMWRAEDSRASGNYNTDPCYGILNTNQTGAFCEKNRRGSAPTLAKLRLPSQKLELESAGG